MASTCAATVTSARARPDKDRLDALAAVPGDRLAVEDGQAL